LNRQSLREPDGGTVEARGKVVCSFDRPAASGLHRWGHPDCRKVGHEYIGRTLAGQIGYDAPQGSHSSIDHRERLGLVYGSQKVVATAKHDMKGAAFRAGHPEISVRLRPQAGVAGAGIEASSANRKVASARPSRGEHEPKRLGQVLDPDRPVGKSSRISCIRQTVTKDHNAIEGRHGLSRGDHGSKHCKDDEETGRAKHHGASWTTGPCANSTPARR